MPNPRLIHEKGRPKSTRIRNEMDDEDRELPTSLWIENGPKSKWLCRQEGHNRRRCPTRNVESTSHSGTYQVTITSPSNDEGYIIRYSYLLFLKYCPKS